ncbi:MAG: CPBP family intramembrane metalloprotease [Dehalococcoidia bacterium]|nr:CPBP family intramembrane metalloprotease [Dehalococcoidia bacterium]
MENTATIFLVLFGIAGLFVIGRFTQRFNHYPIFIKQMIYQVMTLTMALVLLVANRLVHSDYRSALSKGDLGAPTDYFGWLGIKDGTPWSEAVITFLIFPLIITIVVVYFQVLKTSGVTAKCIISVLPAAILLSVFNSLTEEIIFRVIGIEGLSGAFSIATLAILSGLWFGIPHYFGTPGKITGVLMASFLGWVAAISILETGGFAVAWSIHFVQDIPIITMMLAVATKPSRSLSSGCLIDN